MPYQSMGIKMETKFWIVAIFAVLALMAFAVPSFQIASTQGYFNITPQTIYLNWTNSYSANLTVGVNNSNTIYLQNGTFSPYFTSSGSYQGIFDIIAYSDTGQASNNNSISAFKVANFTLNRTIPPSDRPYGRWNQTVYLFNVSNPSNLTDNVSVTVYTDIPVPKGSASIFNGTMFANAPYYHPFFFNTTGVENATGLKINISFDYGDIDLFLLDNSGNLAAKSINRSAGLSKSLIYSFPSLNQMFEIRTYGNNTTSSIPYRGTILFTTLNITNSSNLDQKIASLVLGNLNSTNRTILNLTLKNEGALNLTGISAYREIYWTKNWTQFAGNNTTQFLVPDFATKVMASVFWNGNSNHSVSLYYPNGTLADSSSNKSANAKAAGMVREEYVETNNVPMGLWNITVSNNTAVTDFYNITVKMWFNESQWFSSNFTNNSQTIALNMSGLQTFSFAEQLNLTVPNNTMDGNYAGFIQYTPANAAPTQVPFSFFVNASMLSINNTFRSQTYMLEENYNWFSNATRILNLTINNTGTANLTYVVTNSSQLNLTTNVSKYINFTFSYPAYLNASSGSTINITFNVNSLGTENTLGLYEGWILFNSTSSAQPYSTFNITLRINLTSRLNISINSISVPFMNNTDSPQNMSIVMNITYANGSAYQNITDYRNFTRMWLFQPNASLTSANMGVFRYFSATDDPRNTPGGNDGNYTINATLPANLPGGNYELHVQAVSTNGNYSGEGIYKYAVIGGEGLYLNKSTSSISVANQSSASFTVFVYNYGPNASASGLVLGTNLTGCPISSVTISAVGTGVTASPTPNITLPAVSAYDYSGFVNATWTFTGSGSGSCTPIFYMQSGKAYNNITLPITVSATVSSSSTSSSSSSSSTAATSNTTSAASTSNASANLTITSFPSETRIVQNASGNATVTVKNIGLTNFTGIKIYVDGISQSWYVQPAAQDIGAGVEKTYSITFNIPASASPISYPISYVANNTAATKSASAKLAVLPSNQTAAQIVTNISDYVLKFNRLSALLNQTKAAGANLTEAEGLINQTKTLLNSANAYIKAGDYFSAYQLISRIDGLMSAAEAKIAEAKQNMDRQSGIWIWVAVIAAVIVAAGFVAYLALPPKNGFAPGTGYQYAHPEARGKTRLETAKRKAKEILEKIKSALKKKQQPKPYAYSGPQAPPPFVYKGPPIED